VWCKLATREASERVYDHKGMLNWTFLQPTIKANFERWSMIDQTPKGWCLHPASPSNCKVSITNSRKRASIIDGSCIRYASRINGQFLNNILRRESISVSLCFWFVLKKKNWKKREPRNKFLMGEGLDTHAHLHTHKTHTQAYAQTDEMTRFKDWYKYSWIIFFLLDQYKKDCVWVYRVVKFFYLFFFLAKLSLSLSKTNVCVCSLRYFVVGGGGRRVTQMFNFV
jgi:hypothetical protein